MDLPLRFTERMREQLGSEAEALFTALEGPASTAILMHPTKGCPPFTKSLPVPWNAQGFYLQERPAYVSDPHYHAGAYYPQEASSMLVSWLVSQFDLAPTPRALDLCAAPGGKSLGLLQSLPQDALLVSNEVIRARVKILQENLDRWGDLRSVVTSAHPSTWAGLEGQFDLLLVDAPCSGEGMFRKEPKAVEHWSEENVLFCAERQESILRDIIPVLAEGGYLIYSTCTYAEAENLEMMRYIASQGLEPVSVNPPAHWGLTPIGDASNAYQAYPHMVRGEGFFFACYRRPGNTRTEAYDADASQAPQEALPLDINTPEGYQLSIASDRLELTSARHLDLIADIKSSLKYVHAEHSLGEWKAKKFIPSHTLAMSDLLDNAPSIALDHAQSIAYLRRETFSLDGHDDGWYLAQYESSTLGWIKIAAGRMKNHYPKEWMIRKRW